MRSGDIGRVEVDEGEGFEGWMSKEEVEGRWEGLKKVGEGQGKKGIKVATKVMFDTISTDSRSLNPTQLVNVYRFSNSIRLLSIRPSRSNTVDYSHRPQNAHFVFNCILPAFHWRRSTLRKKESNTMKEKEKRRRRKKITV